LFLLVANNVNLVYYLIMKTSPYSPLGQLLLGAFRWFDESLHASLAARDRPPLSHTQSLVFAYLDEGGTRSAELARRAGISRQAMHKTVRELVDLDLVALVPDPTHGGARLVVLTYTGRAYVADIQETFAAIEAALSERIGPISVTALRQTLEAEWGEPVTAKE
jgi:DNA-binding MarR family transcriptional regulator